MLGIGIDVCAITDKLKMFTELEFKTFSGVINFVGFLVCVFAIGSGKTLRAVWWFIEIVYQSFVKLFSKDKNFSAVNFPEDKWGPWPIILTFVFLVICIIYLNYI